MARSLLMLLLDIFLFLLSALGAPAANVTAPTPLGNNETSPASHHLEKRRKHEGWITLINATPFDWKRAHMHSYQLDVAWPETVPTGT